MLHQPPAKYAGRNGDVADLHPRFVTFPRFYVLWRRAAQHGFKLGLEDSVASPHVYITERFLIHANVTVNLGLVHKCHVRPLVAP